jgi:hypothetical protein
VVSLLGPPRPRPPAPSRRDLLVGLDAYARLVTGGTERLVGTIEATAGCNHRCRHCPVPTVYNGRSRPAELAGLLRDVDELVAAGATHLHLADPDFLNRPRHALALARALHRNHPGLSFDATIKVSHIVEQAEVVGELAACGLLFVTSAVESTSEVVLARLDKGHRATDAVRAVAVLRAVGVEMRPSLLPFTPWTTRRDLLELLDFVASCDLVWNVDPVQYSIRLLLPPGSLLLSSPDPVLSAALGDFDPSSLGYPWRSADPLLDELAVELAAMSEEAEAEGAPIEATYGAIRAHVFARCGAPDIAPPRRVAPGPAGPDRPRLTESWFCCAEPTAGQLGLLATAPVTRQPVTLRARGGAREGGTREEMMHGAGTNISPT